MNIIFDLDGTLIDSSNGILSALDLAFTELQITPIQPLNSKLIGPPLKDLLPQLVAEESLDKVDSISESFKQKYDSEGYKNTFVFDYVEVMLNQLSDDKHQLYIVTNKRANPTEKIIDYLDWRSYFKGIYALDTFPAFTKKAELIKHVIDSHNMDKKQTLYVGDTLADMKASAENDIAFLMAMWGYDADHSSNFAQADSPKAVLDHIAATIL